VGRRPRRRPARRLVVSRREAERRRELPGPAPSRARRPGRVLLGGRAGRPSDHHLRRAPRRRAPVRCRAALARRPAGRPGRAPHGTPAGDGRRDARVREARRRPRGARAGASRRGARRPDRRPRAARPRHPGRLVAARCRAAAEGKGRRGDGGCGGRAAHDRRPAHRDRRRLVRGRPLVRRRPRRSGRRAAGRASPTIRS